MALIKKLYMPTGSEAEYHNLSVYKNSPDNYLEVTVNSYLSAYARNSGCSPITRRNYLVPSEFWKNDNKLEKSGYDYIKTLPDFEGALDDEK